MMEMIAKRNAKRAAEREEKEKEVARERIVSEVAKWARDKNIKAMLNEVNGLKTPDKNALKRQSTLTPVTKAYRKALLKIHPDKHQVCPHHCYSSSSMSCNLVHVSLSS
jgi:hypothetical protein